MAQKSTDTPHSWSVNAWPASVYPNLPNRGRYLVNAHKTDLMAAGALVRVGRELVVMGTRYARWLERQAVNVPDFEIAPNRERDSAAA